MTSSSASASVGNLEQEAPVGAAPRPGRGCAAPAPAALPTDHLADVVGRDVEAEDDRVLTLLRLDAHGVRLVDEPTRDPLEELSQRWFVALMSLATGAVGCAPFAIQSSIFAWSSSMVEGSVRGL